MNGSNTYPKIRGYSWRIELARMLEGLGREGGWDGERGKWFKTVVEMYIVLYGED